MKKQQYPVCPSCGTRGPVSPKDPAALADSGLLVAWEEVCEDCYNEFDAFARGERVVARLHRLSAGVRAALPHPDSSRGGRDECRECQASDRHYGSDAAVMAKRDDDGGYVALYVCEHGSRRRRWWGAGMVVDLLPEVWTWRGNHRRRPNEITVRGPIPRDIPSHEDDDMQRYVRFYRDGESMAISTNVTDETEFQMLVPSALADFLDAASKKQEKAQWIAASVPLIVDLSCKLRGYKAPLVDEQRVLTAGKIPPRDALLSASSEESRPNELSDPDRRPVEVAP